MERFFALIGVIAILGAAVYGFRYYLKKRRSSGEGSSNSGSPGAGSNQPRNVSED